VKPRTTLILSLALLVTLTIAAAVLTREEGAAGSTLSLSAEGWLGTRRVLLSRGVETAVLDAPRDRPEPGVMVVVFPWQHGAFERPFAAARQHLYAGGTLVVGYTGERLGILESAALDELGLSRHEARPRAPLGLAAWRRYAREVWTLRPAVAELEALRAVKVSALRMAPVMPTDGRALFKSPNGDALVFEFPVGAGRAIVMPAELLANGRLSEPGNADWLATLAASLPGPWAFDEYHHGLVAPHAAAPGEVRTEHFMDLYLAQIALIYGLAVLAVVLRFGPAWRDPAVVSGSVASFLVGLGAIHEKGRHHADAATTLAARARELDRRLTLDEETEARARTGPAAFLELARRVAKRQWRRNG
jgi:hypothetical protein